MFIICYQYGKPFYKFYAKWVNKKQSLCLIYYSVGIYFSTRNTVILFGPLHKITVYSDGMENNYRNIYTYSKTDNDNIILFLKSYTIRIYFFKNHKIIVLIAPTYYTFKK